MSAVMLVLLRLFHCCECYAMEIIFWIQYKRISGIPVHLSPVGKSEGSFSLEKEPLYR